MIRVERNYFFPEKSKEGLIQGSNPYDTATFKIGKNINIEDIDYKYPDKIHNGVFISKNEDGEIRSMRVGDFCMGSIIDDNANVTQSNKNGVVSNTTLPNFSLFEHEIGTNVSIMRQGYMSMIIIGEWNVGDFVGVRVEKVVDGDYFLPGSLISLGDGEGDVEGYQMLHNATFVDSYANQEKEYKSRKFVDPVTNQVSDFRLAKVVFDCRNLPILT